MQSESPAGVSVNVRPSGETVLRETTDCVPTAAVRLAVLGFVEALAISGGTIRVPLLSREDGQPLSVDNPAFSFQAPAAEWSAAIATVPARTQSKAVNRQRFLMPENIPRFALTRGR